MPLATSSRRSNGTPRSISAAVPVVPITGNPSGVADLRAGADLAATPGASRRCPHIRTRATTSRRWASDSDLQLLRAAHPLVSALDGGRLERASGEPADQWGFGGGHGAGARDLGAVSGAAGSLDGLLVADAEAADDPQTSHRSGVRQSDAARDTSLPERRSARPAGRPFHPRRPRLRHQGEARFAGQYSYPPATRTITRLRPILRLALKLGDIFHSNPQLVSEPENVFYYKTNLHNYQDFFSKHQHRRRVLYAGANDGLLHAFDVGVWNRDVSADATQGKDPTAPVSICTGGLTDCYDIGTGAELFAYAPRAIMQIFSPLTNALGVQNKTGRVDRGRRAVGCRHVHRRQSQRHAQGQ